MKLREAKSSDIAELESFERELFSPENYPLSKGSLRYHIKHNLFYVAELDGAVAGYMLVLIKRSDAKVYSLGVSRAFRGKNIATEMLHRAIKELKSLGFKKVVLEVRKDNHSAITLYEKTGFKTTKILNAFYLDGCDAYFMQMELEDANTSL